MQGNSLQNEARVNKAMDRLRAMGIKFHTETPNINEMMLVIELDSAIDALMKQIMRAIEYPKKEIARANEGSDKYLLVHFWKGETPEYRLTE